MSLAVSAGERDPGAPASTARWRSPGSQNACGKGTCPSTCGPRGTQAGRGRLCGLPFLLKPCRYLLSVGPDEQGNSRSELLHVPPGLAHQPDRRTLSICAAEGDWLRMHVPKRERSSSCAAARRLSVSQVTLAPSPRATRRRSGSWLAFWAGHAIARDFVLWWRGRADTADPLRWTRELSISKSVASAGGDRAVQRRSRRISADTPAARRAERRRPTFAGRFFRASKLQRALEDAPVAELYESLSCGARFCVCHFCHSPSTATL